MRKILQLFLFATLLAGTSTVIYSCGGSNTASEQQQQQGKEYTSAYICPMHCAGSGSEEPGKCPVCGMDYVKNETHQTNEVPHDRHEEHAH